VESSETGRRETPHQGLRAATGIGSSASSSAPKPCRAQPRDGRDDAIRLLGELGASEHPRWTLVNAA
jgi:hypothetical protein